MIVPSIDQRVQEVAIERGLNIDSDMVNEVILNHIPQSRVQLLPALVQYHSVGIAVEFLETQATIILVLDFDNGHLQAMPDLHQEILVHDGLNKDKEI